MSFLFIFVKHTRWNFSVWVFEALHYKCFHFQEFARHWGTSMSGNIILHNSSIRPLSFEMQVSDYRNPNVQWIFFFYLSFQWKLYSKWYVYIFLFFSSSKEQFKIHYFCYKFYFFIVSKSIIYFCLIHISFNYYINRQHVCSS